MPSKLQGSCQQVVGGVPCWPVAGGGGRSVSLTPVLCWGQVNQAPGSFFNTVQLSGHSLGGAGGWQEVADIPSKAWVAGPWRKRGGPIFCGIPVEELGEFQKTKETDITRFGVKLG